MSAANTPAAHGSAGPAVNGSPGIPGLDVDPFAIEFFENPFPTHEVLREAGPVVHLDKWNVYAVARYAEVYAVLNDALTFCSSPGACLSDFATVKPLRPQTIVHEATPPPPPQPPPS